MGEQFGRYVVERRLALGGMAEVCLARQIGPSGFDRVCVLKRMPPELATMPELVELFLHESADRAAQPPEHRAGVRLR